jgi:hypothetical protein
VPTQGECSTDMALLFFVRSFIHSFIHSFVYSFIHSLSFIYSTQAHIGSLAASPHRVTCASRCVFCSVYAFGTRLQAQTPTREVPGGALSRCGDRQRASARASAGARLLFLGLAS